MSSQVSILASAVVSALLAIQAQSNIKFDESMLAKFNELAAATPALSAEDMMLPVDAKPVKTPKALKVAVTPVVNVAQEAAAEAPADPSDTLRSHWSRLKSINSNLCMARKIDEANPIPGTRRTDPGANGMFWPEKQCAKAPMPGSKLCKICQGKNDEAAAGNPHKQWYGRLDEPMYKNAKVVGCAHYFEKYPKGIPGDASSASAPSDASATAAALAPAPAPVAVVEAPADKKKPGRKAKVAEPAVIASESTASEPAAPESVAVNTAPKALEWITCKWTNKAGESEYFVRNTRNGNVYARNGDAVLPTEAAIRDQFKGRWVDGTLDEFADEVQDE